MSVIYKGALIDNSLSINAKGGTEFIRDILLKSLTYYDTSKTAIHFSRPNKIYEDVKNIFYAHDLPEDSSNDFVYNNIEKFDAFVFVSEYQKFRYLTHNNQIPLHKCHVVYNTTGQYETLKLGRISKKMNDVKNKDIRFIYHTTPHRGLEVLYHVFDELSKKYENIHLDVYSSFDIYGWGERDNQFSALFEMIKNHKNMTYSKNIPRETLKKILPKYDVFLYPCIWEETYCIALSEAIENGILCVHNNYGCLPETSFGNTIMYNTGDSIQSLYDNSIKTMSCVLDDFQEIKKHVLKKSIYNLSKDCKFTLESFQKNWERVLNEVLSD